MAKQPPMTSTGMINGHLRTRTPVIEAPQ